MKRVKLVALAMAVVLLCGMLLTGCGKETVNLNRYVKFHVEGFDGYGTVTPYIDVDALVKDYKEFVNDEDSIKTPDGRAKKGEAVKYIIEAKNPFKMKYDARTDYKNGDVIELTWKEKESAVEKLQEFLDVKFTYEDFTYKVEGLSPIQQIDPLSDEYLTVEFSGDFSGDCYMYAECRVPVGENDVCYLEVTIDKEAPYKNGDVITLSFQRNEYYEENFGYYREAYGIEFMESEKQITVSGLNYVPMENPQEALDGLTQESYDNVLASLKQRYTNYAGEMQYELVGVAYYGASEAMENRATPYNANLLVFVYHLDNGLYPDGWYQYMATGDVFMGKVEKEDGSVAFETLDYSYRNETAMPSGRYDYGVGYNYLTHEGLYYDGYATLEECMQEFIENYVGRNYSGYEYDKVVATEGLQEFVTAG